jgi:hypothetical protein
MALENTVLSGLITLPITYYEPPSAGVVTITSTGRLVSNSNKPTLTLYNGPYTLNVDGTIQSKINSPNMFVPALAIFDSASTAASKINVGATGWIESERGAAITYINKIDLNNAGMISGGLQNNQGLAGQISNINNSGTILSADKAIFGGTASIEKITNSGIIRGNVAAMNLFGGDDVVINKLTGQIFGNIDLGTGNNLLFNEGTINNDIIGGENVETIKNFGTIKGHLKLNAGADDITNSGTIDGQVQLGSGANKLTNSGLIKGGVFAEGTEINNISNTGTINGGITTASGADVVNSSGKVAGEIFLGAGDDLFNGGNHVDILRDSAGSDTYRLGGGDDRYLAVEDSHGGIDTIDAGDQTPAAGITPSIYGDLYDASAATSSVNINIDTVVHTQSVLGYGIIANRATGNDIGSDHVFNFESVLTGSGDDLIFGNAAVNVIGAGNGNDKLYGYAGNDILMGGGNSDFIVGGLGADQLWGSGAGRDFSRDTFRFDNLNESTVATTGRDRINDFDDSNANVALNDVIDFRGLTTVAGKHFNRVGDGVNNAFDGQVGAVRVMTTTQGWTVEMDANGDRVADMAIDVLDTAHIITWNASNFLF